MSIHISRDIRLQQEIRYLNARNACRFQGSPRSSWHTHANFYFAPPNISNRFFLVSQATTNALNHLRTKHHLYEDKEHHKWLQNAERGPMDSHLVANQSTPQTFREALLDFVIKTDQSFAVVEDPYFQNLIRVLNPLQTIISADTLRRDVKQKFETDQKSLKALLQVQNH